MTYATVEDITILFRPLTQMEADRAGALLPLVSSALREAAANVGKDLDAMATASADYANVCKMVTVDVVARVLRQSTTGDPMTQESQSGLGYSWSGTYAVPGGGISSSIMRNDLKRLGLLRQKVGTIQLWENSQTT